MKEVTIECDGLNLKCEAMTSKLKDNNVEFDAKAFEPKPAAGDAKEGVSNVSLIPKGSLVDQYK